MNRRILFFATASMFCAGLWTSQAQADDPKPCTAKSFKIAKVKAACEAGGQPAAKKLMKAATKKAKAAGETMTCKTCHDNLKTFSLAGDDPVGKIKKWL